MDSLRSDLLKVGNQVAITQQVAARHYALATKVVGTVVKYEQRPTGSWFAHSDRDKLWLDRVVIKKPDGEITTLNLDEYSHVEILSPTEVAPPTEVAR
jgi:hypothetical protein